jgi:hypothetical protein
MEPDIEAELQKSFLGRLPRDLVDRLVDGQLRMDVPADTTIYREGEASFERTDGDCVVIAPNVPAGARVALPVGRSTRVLS